MYRPVQHERAVGFSCEEIPEGAGRTCVQQLRPADGPPRRRVVRLGETRCFFHAAGEAATSWTQRFPTLIEAAIALRLANESLASSASVEQMLADNRTGHRRPVPPDPLRKEQGREKGKAGGGPG